MNKRTTKRPTTRREPAFDEVFAIDPESESLAEEFIAEATSAEHIGEDARNEAFFEETTGLYSIDVTALDEDALDEP